MRRTLLIVLAAACGHGEDFSSERPSPSDLIGNSCGNDADCSQHCAGGGRFPGGFCTVQCKRNSDCPDGTVCINRDNGICLYPCARSLDCAADFLGRGGYNCDFQNGFPEEDVELVRYMVCIAD